MPARLGNNPEAFNDHHHHQGGAPKKVAREVQKGSKESSYQIPLVPMNLRKVNQIEINNKFPTYQHPFNEKVLPDTRMAARNAPQSKQRNPM